MRDIRPVEISPDRSHNRIIGIFRADPDKGGASGRIDESGEIFAGIADIDDPGQIMILQELPPEIQSSNGKDRRHDRGIGHTDKRDLLIQIPASHPAADHVHERDRNILLVEEEAEIH